MAWPGQALACGALAQSTAPPGPLAVPRSLLQSYTSSAFLRLSSWCLRTWTPTCRPSASLLGAPPSWDTFSADWVEVPGLLALSSPALVAHNGRLCVLFDTSSSHQSCPWRSQTPWRHQVRLFYCTQTRASFAPDEKRGVGFVPYKLRICRVESSSIHNLAARSLFNYSVRYHCTSLI